MADTKPSVFPHTVPASKDADYVPYTKDLTGTPLDKTMTLEEFFTALHLLTSISDIDSDSADEVLIYQANGTVAKRISVDNLFKGIYDISIPAGAMYPRTTTGCAAAAQKETTTNKINFKVLDFDQTTKEYAQFAFRLPRQYDGSTVTFIFTWTAESGSGSVVWEVSARCFTDDDALDQALGTAITVTDTLLTAGDDHESAATSAVTIAGTPAGGKWCLLQFARVAADGADTLAVDARLIEVTMRIGINKKASA